MTEEFPSLAGRLVYVSRGGAAVWASDLAAESVDVFDLMSPADVTAGRPKQKERSVTPLEETLINGVRQRLRISEEIRVLSTSLLFNFYYRAIKIDQRAFARSVEHGDRQARGLAAIYRPLPSAPRPPEALDLPKRFCAIRFYGRPSFPDTDANRAWVQNLVGRLAQHRSVVLLNNEFVPDDHPDIDIGAGSVVGAGAHMQAVDNLAIQTGIVAASDTLVGTYGGLSYLAPLLGRRAVGFASHPDGALPWHLDLAQRLFTGTDGWGTILVLHPNDLDTLAPIVPLP